MKHHKPLHVTRKMHEASHAENENIREKTSLAAHKLWYREEFKECVSEHDGNKETT